MGYIYPEESKELMRLVLLLHNELGCGFREKVYQDALEVLLRENNILYEREKHITMQYHGVILEHDYFYDFFCYGKIGVEVKAVRELLGEHEAQIINYLHVGNHRLGLLVNFGTTSLQYKWFVNKKLL